MNPRTSPDLDGRRWQQCYRAAILEKNRSVVLQRISEAENAVLARCREVFYDDGTPEEKDALEDALYALRAFRAALEHTEAAEAA